MGFSSTKEPGHKQLVTLWSFDLPALPLNKRQQCRLQTYYHLSENKSSKGNKKRSKKTLKYFLRLPINPKTALFSESASFDCLPYHLGMEVQRRKIKTTGRLPMHANLRALQPATIIDSIMPSNVIKSGRGKQPGDDEWIFGSQNCALLHPRLSPRYG